jgi:hypothetical protein
MNEAREFWTVDMSLYDELEPITTTITSCPHYIFKLLMVKNGLKRVSIGTLNSIEW